MSFLHVSNRNYTRMLKAEQLRNAPAQPVKPVIKVNHTPAKPMDADKLSRLNAAMAEIEAQRVAA